MSTKKTEEKRRHTERKYYKLDNNHPAMEAYRVLRTNLDFSSADKQIKTLLITSSVMGEGKSTTAANLAMMFADAGKKTLLVDMDLRKPSQHKIFQLRKDTGISSVISGLAKIEDVTCKTDYEGLYVIPCGFRPPNPSEMLNSERAKDTVAKLREMYDMVIIDSPPSIALTDSLLLSNYCDATILIVSAGNVAFEEVGTAISNLKSVNANLIGVVMNNLKRTSNGNYYYYYYYYD